MHHGRDREPPIENDAFVLELAGWKLLHMGDSQCTAQELGAFGLDEAEVDVAFVPSWYLDAGPWKGAIDAEIRPGRTVVMHLAPDWTREQETSNQRESRAQVGRILEAYPQAVVFEEVAEVRRFEAD
jgi:L-ascorbate metabolism protein UlaG (beta-lactamase superfamily)